MRFIGHYARNAYTVFGIFLLSGTVIAVLFTWAFAEVAQRVRAGSTQGFDDAVMHWMAAHQSKVVQTAMLEVTSLGTGTVVGVIGLRMSGA